MTYTSVPSLLLGDQLLLRVVRWLDLWPMRVELIGCYVLIIDSILERHYLLEPNEYTQSLQNYLPARYSLLNTRMELLCS